jgi:5-formyltetrahydrofolate cyclo-ligase
MKDVIRREILAKRTSQKGAVKLAKDAMIKEKLLSLPEFRDSKVILFYMSIRGEVKTDSMISEVLQTGKKVLVPVADVKNRRLLISEIHDLNELSPGSFGVPEPKHPHEFPIDKIDLVIIPGIAFDRKGDRIGYGTGFYDRFLKTLKKTVPFIALAYDLQIVPEIPKDEMDVRISKIITEKEVIECAADVK